LYKFEYCKVLSTIVECADMASETETQYSLLESTKTRPRRDDMYSENESETSLLDESRQRVYGRRNNTTLLHWTAHVGSLFLCAGLLAFIVYLLAKMDRSCALKHNIYSKRSTLHPYTCNY
jgi:hypothetical protein